MSDNIPAVSHHLHWEFLAHDAEEGAKEIHWGVGVIVIGYQNEDDARIASQAIVTRRTHILRRVWECATCGYGEKLIHTIEKITE